MKTLPPNDNKSVPIKVWSDLEKVELSAMQLLKNVAGLPFVFKHVAAMPDVHFGRGATQCLLSEN